MIFYKSIIQKNLFIYTIVFTIFVLSHIIVSSIVRNFLYYNMILLVTLTLMSLITLILVPITLKSCINKTNNLYNILYNDCNPILAIKQADEYLNDIILNKHKIIIKSFLAICYFRSNNYNEASIIYQDGSINKSKVSTNTKIMWYHNVIMILIKLYDYENESKVVDHFNYLSRMYPNKAKKFFEYSESQKMYKKFIEKDFDECKRYYELQLDCALNNYEKVIYNANLVFIYKRLNIDFKQNLGYVLEHGNTLSIVEEVNQLIGEVR